MRSRRIYRNLKLPRYDSNVDRLSQSQVCYQLHHRAMSYRFTASRISRKLPRYDSNVDFLVQSQACYRLHHRAKCTAQTKNPEAGLRGLVCCFIANHDLVTWRAVPPAVVEPAARMTRSQNA